MTLLHHAGRAPLVVPSEQNPVGVFDSGIGGLSVLRALRAVLPAEDFVYVDDSRHAPYGERGEAHAVDRAMSITTQLRERHRIKALVVACNTATMAAVATLRQAHPDLPIVGVEPALKPAAGLTRTRHVGVIATRGTLDSARFKALRLGLADRAEFTVQPCDGLADTIQRSVASGDSTEIQMLSAKYLGTMGQFGCAAGQMDVLVLGCTHYIFAEAQLRALLGPAVLFVSTGEPVARRTKEVLEAAGSCAFGRMGRTRLVTTGEPAGLQAAAERWLGLAPAPAFRWA